MTRVTEHLQTRGVPFEAIAHQQAYTSIAEARALGIDASEVLKTVATRAAGGDPVASRRFDELVDVAEVRVEAVTAGQARVARDAYRDFGKGSGHKAGLNFGDCFAYALAKATGEALLFKGDDFGHTDITPALPSATADETR